MKLFNIKIKWFFLSVGIYLIIYLICMYNLMIYEANYSPSQGEFFSFFTLSFMMKINWVIYRYLLNFPLSFFNWFIDDTLQSTVFFLIPNSISTTVIVVKLNIFRINFKQNKIRHPTS